MACTDPAAPLTALVPRGRYLPTGELVDEIVLVGGATHMVAVRKLVSNLFEVDPRRTVDPMQAVALGAAVHAGVLSGEVHGVRVLQSWQAKLGRLLDAADDTVDKKGEPGAAAATAGGVAATAAGGVSAAGGAAASGSPDDVDVVVLVEEGGDDADEADEAAEEAAAAAAWMAAQGLSGDATAETAEPPSTSVDSDGDTADVPSDAPSAHATPEVAEAGEVSEATAVDERASASEHGDPAEGADVSADLEVAISADEGNISPGEIARINRLFGAFGGKEGGINLDSAGTPAGGKRSGGETAGGAGGVGEGLAAGGAGTGVGEDGSLDAALAAMELLYGDAADAAGSLGDGGSAYQEDDQEDEEDEEVADDEERLHEEVADDEELLPAAKRAEIDALFRSFGGKEGRLGDE